jgi:2-aminobenzoate-CoA ligase
VDADTPGLDSTEHIAVMAPHPLATLKFNGLRCGQQRQLGALNGGFKLAMQTLDIFRASVAGAALGMARRALPRPCPRKSAAQMFGQTLADFQLTQARLGEMAALVDAAPADLPRRLAARLCRHGSAAAGAGLHRASRHGQDDATENAQRVIDMALQMHGGLGVKVGTKVESLYRDIRSLRIYEGATEVQQLIIGKSVLKGVSACSFRANRPFCARPPAAARAAGRAALRPARAADPGQLNLVRNCWTRRRARGFADRRCCARPGETLTYARRRERVDRIAQVLVQDLGLVPGNRVLLRGGNSIGMALAWLAVVKAGLVAVATMPLLRAKELGDIIDKAQPVVALCDAKLLDELAAGAGQHPVLRRIVRFNALTPVPGPGSRDARRARAGAFGLPHRGRRHRAAGLHLRHHRQAQGRRAHPPRRAGRLRTWPRHVLRATPDDIVMGSPPLAFTFGLGGMLLFPMWAGARCTSPTFPTRPRPWCKLINASGPPSATPRPRSTARWRPLQALQPALPTLRICVSAGEALPDATRQLWKEATGIEMLDGIGATEMFHIFISSAPLEVRRGAIGKVVPGYTAKVVDETRQRSAARHGGQAGGDRPHGLPLPGRRAPGQLCQGRLELPGRRLRAGRRRLLLLPGARRRHDHHRRLQRGRPEVEDACSSHPAVAECGVIGKPDDERGMIVKAFCVLKPGNIGDAAMVKALQDHVKASIAPYKYPREIEFVASCRAPKPASSNASG